MPTVGYGRSAYSYGAYSVDSNVHPPTQWTPIVDTQVELWAKIDATNPPQTWVSPAKIERSVFRVKEPAP